MKQQETTRRTSEKRKGLPENFENKDEQKEITKRDCESEQFDLSEELRAELNAVMTQHTHMKIETADDIIRFCAWLRASSFGRRRIAAYEKWARSYAADEKPNVSKNRKGTNSVSPNAETSFDDDREK